MPRLALTPSSLSLSVAWRGVLQDVKEALNRLPQKEVDLRNQRIKRAIDISQKHTELPEELKKLQTPFNFYLKPMVEQIETENAERVGLGTGKPYDRQIP